MKRSKSVLTRWPRLGEGFLAAALLLTRFHAAGEPAAPPPQAPAPPAAKAEGAKESHGKPAPGHETPHAAPQSASSKGGASAPVGPPVSPSATHREPSTADGPGGGSAEPGDESRKEAAAEANAAHEALRSLQAASVEGSTNNVAIRRPELGRSPRYEEFQRWVESARELRKQKDYEKSRQTLIWLLETPAPAEFHRPALLELGLVAEETQELAKAQQIYAQYIKKYPTDPGVPELYLRQGMIFRAMGAPTLALGKFYAVMSTSLSLKPDQMAYYKNLVLRAQTEVADTFYLQGRYVEAADFFRRLLKLENPDLNRPGTHYKLIRSLSFLGHSTEVVAEGQMFVDRFGTLDETPEVRFLMAESLRKLGRNRDAMLQVKLLLESEQARASKNPEIWRSWQLRTGNDIANQLYREGDYINALEVYTTLAQIDPQAEWQAPVWYQIGLIYERLEQPEKAVATYTQITDREKEFTTTPPTPGLAAVFEMAKWRRKNVEWTTGAEAAARRLAAGGAGSAPEAKESSE